MNYLNLGIEEIRHPITPKMPQFIDPRFPEFANPPRIMLERVRVEFLNGVKMTACIAAHKICLYFRNIFLIALELGPEEEPPADYFRKRCAKAEEYDADTQRARKV